jgi:hypothetical protein
VKETIRPSTEIVPDVGAMVPDSRFIKVDLPAPLAPHTAWTSPASAAKSTWSSASTPGNRRVSALVCSRGIEVPAY